MSVLKTYIPDTGEYKPSTTYRINQNHIEGKIDGLQAVEQAASLALSIERFEHIIYSLDYGSELQRFIGKDRGYITGDIERCIAETLAEDDRIEGITDFTLSFDGEAALISFSVQSAFGSFNIERSFNIGR